MIKDPIRKRMLQMRWTAKYHGKTIPSISELENLIPKDMKCPVCSRTMNWFRKEGHSTVITLQHDRDGSHRILCQACNVRHAFREGDSFYQSKDLKRCQRCGELKPYTDFYADNSKRWQNKFGKCKPCTALIGKEYVSKNRRRFNEKRRAYYHKRKTSGNPIPRSNRHAMLKQSEAKS